MDIGKVGMRGDQVLQQRQVATRKIDLSSNKISDLRTVVLLVVITVRPAIIRECFA